MSDPGDDDMVGPGVGVRSPLPGKDRERRPSGRLRTTVRRGHHLVEAAGDHRAAGLSEQPADRERDVLPLRAAPDHGDLRRHDPIVSITGMDRREARGDTLVLGGRFAGDWVARLLRRSDGSRASRGACRRSQRPDPGQPARMRRSAFPSDCLPPSAPAKRSPSRATRSSTSSIVKASGSRPGADLVPAQRRRHRSTRAGTHGVDARRRLAGAVLVRVDEHAAALALRPLGRDEARMRPRERSGDDTGELAHGGMVVAPARSERARAGRGSRSSWRSSRAPAARAPLAAAAPPRRPPRSPCRSDGSRSNITQSGRSGRSARDAHACMSMQPMFTAHRSASSSSTQGVLDHTLLACPRRRGERCTPDPLRHVRSGPASGRSASPASRRDTASS